MSNREEYAESVNCNIIRPADNRRLREGSHHLSGARPIGSTTISNSVVILEVGYAHPIEPRRVAMPPRYMTVEWDNRPA